MKEEDEQTQKKSKAFCGVYLKVINSLPYSIYT